jgi:hypothetical protein
MDDPRDNVPDELESRLDDLSATLTEDDISTRRGTSSVTEPDDADMDDQDADADDADQDADADDPGA